MPDGKPISVQAFSGLCTYIDPTNMPVFASPDCPNVQFVPGSVSSRPGLTATPLTGTGNINYIKTYVTNAGLVRTLWLDSAGNLYKENVTENPGVRVLISGNLEPNGYGQSTTLFGREFIAISDGQTGLDIPWSYNDGNLDRVSQSGPGAPPIAADDNFSTTIAAPATGATQFAAVAITSISQSGLIITVVTSSGYGLNVVGEGVVIAGVPIAGYNGSWTVASIISSTSFTFIGTTGDLAASSGGTVASTTGILRTGANPFVIGSLNPNFSVGQTVVVAGVGVGGYNGTWHILGTFTYSAPPIREGVYVKTNSSGLAASGNGTIASAGNIIAGLHQITVIFVTRNGYFTAPAPPGSWQASGGNRVFVTNIPTGPPDVVQRILLFTASAGANFYYSTTETVGVLGSSFIIDDNVTTAGYFDFTDALLLDGTNADDLFDLLVLGPCSQVTSYNQQLFWCGELNKINNFINMQFDGGAGTNVSSQTYPLGWTPAFQNYNGGAVTYSNAVFGGSFQITGAGPFGTSILGYIQQSAYQDYLGNPIIQSSTAYSVRVRVARNALLANGTLTIRLATNSGPIGTPFDITAAQTTERFQTFTGPLINAVLLSPVPADLRIEVLANAAGIPPYMDAGGIFWVDELDIFPTNNPINGSIVRVSDIEDPDSYFGADGFLQPAEENGQFCHNTFVIRDFLYILKDRSLFVTAATEDPTNTWTIREVSSTVGGLGPRCVGMGDEWVIIGNETGAWLFEGGTLSPDNNMTKEIQPTWAGINWAVGYFLDVKIDTNRKRIYIDTPFGASSINSVKFALDYTEGFGDPLGNGGSGRKWSPWTYAGNSQNLILRETGNQVVYIGSNNGTGKIWLMDNTATSDDGNAFIAYWQSGYFQQDTRLNFTYVVANIVGQGICNLTLKRGDQGKTKVIRGWLMNLFGFNNMERVINIEAERMSIIFGTSAAGDKFSLQGFTVYVKPSSNALVRGINAAH